MAADEINPIVDAPENEDNKSPNEPSAPTEEITAKETNNAEEEQQENTKERTKKSMSITRALILFGYESWIALEPGTAKILVAYISFKIICKPLRKT